MLKEFKEFIARGNVMDLAVGVIIGTAFGNITSSLVDDVIMPLVGLLLGKVDFSNLFVTLSPGNLTGPATTLAEAKAAGAVTLNIGLFINTLINFLIIAAAVFVIVKAFNRLRRETPPAPAEPSAEVVLLTEIRDELKRARS